MPGCSRFLITRGWRGIYIVTWADLDQARDRLSTLFNEQVFPRPGPADVVATPFPFVSGLANPGGHSISRVKVPDPTRRPLSSLHARPARSAAGTEGRAALRLLPVEADRGRVWKSSSTTHFITRNADFGLKRIATRTCRRSKLARRRFGSPVRLGSQTT